MKKVSLILVLFLLWSVPVYAGTLRNYLSYCRTYETALYYELSWSSKSIVAIFTDEHVPGDIVSLLLSKERQGIPVVVIVLLKNAISLENIRKLEQAHIRIMWDYTKAGMLLFQQNVYVIDGSIIYNGQAIWFRFENSKLAGRLTNMVIK